MLDVAFHFSLHPTQRVGGRHSTCKPVSYVIECYSRGSDPGKENI